MEINKEISGDSGGSKLGCKLSRDSTDRSIKWPNMPGFHVTVASGNAGQSSLEVLQTGDRKLYRWPEMYGKLVQAAIDGAQVTKPISFPVSSKSIVLTAQ
jgi:hypothetical protein